MTWYAQTVEVPRARPPLQGDHTCDVCIVGGGYTGLCTALELARAGRRVMLLEAETFGHGASGCNGGQIVSGFNPSMTEVEQTVGPEDARILWDLAEEGKRLVHERIAEHQIACDLKPGYLYVALNAVHVRELEALHREVAHTYGLQGVRLLDERAVRDYVDSPRCTGGVYDPTGGHLNPLSYLLGLVRAAEHAGVRLHERSRVLRVDTGGQPAVRTTHGSVRAGAVVLAGNAYLGNLLAPLRGYILPASTFMLATDRLDDAIARSLIPSGAAICDMKFVLNYYRMTPDRRLLFGGGLAPAARQDKVFRDRLASQMRWVFPQLSDVGIASFWSGRVALTRNRLPHVGRVGPRTYFAHGFSGHGLTITAICARLIAEALGGSPERFDVFARIPHKRFPGSSRLEGTLITLASAWFGLRDRAAHRSCLLLTPCG